MSFSSTNCSYHYTVKKTAYLELQLQLRITLLFPVLRLTFTSLTSESIIVVSRGLVSTYNTQFLPFNPSSLWQVPASLAHSRHNRGALLHLRLIAALEGSFPQFIYPCVWVPFVSIILWVVVLSGIVWSGRHCWLHELILHAGIAGEG